MNLITENEMLKRDIAELKTELKNERTTAERLIDDKLYLTCELERIKPILRHYKNKSGHYQAKLNKLRANRELFNTHSDTKKAYYGKK